MCLCGIIFIFVDQILLSSMSWRYQMISHEKTTSNLKFQSFPEFFRMVDKTVQTIICNSTHTMHVLYEYPNT